MHSNTKWGLLGVLLTVTAIGAVYGDVVVPDRRPKNETFNYPVVIMIDQDAQEVHLQVPEQFLEAPNPTAGAALPPGRTVLAGLAISAAVGSVFFVNRGNRFVRGTALSVVGLAALLTASGMLLADMPSPYRDSHRHQRLRPREYLAELQLPAGTMIRGEVIVEVVPDGEAIIIILPSRLKSKPSQPQVNPYEAPSVPPPAPVPAPPS